MAKIEDLLAKIKDSVQSKITAESPKEDIEFASGIDATLEEIKSEYAKKDAELHDVKDMLIKSMRKEGSSEQVAEHDEQKPQTLEEIARDLLAKESKKD